jgi:hypothetical protein
MIPVGILSAAATSSFSFLLDEYPSAVAAYSLRKLRSAYTGNCIRVRRDDSSELNIGFVNNVVDVATLTTFCGVGNGFVTIWYDQSGNGNNATQNILIQQTKIVVTGILQTLNSKPIINVVDAFFNLTTGINSDTNTFFNLVGKSNSLATNGIFLGSLGVGPLMGQTAGGFSFNSANNGSFYVANNSVVTRTTNYVIMTGISNSSNLFFYRNDVNITLTKSLDSYSFVFNTINNYSSAFGDGLISEIIIYKTDQTSNRTGINTNINNYYTIY